MKQKSWKSDKSSVVPNYQNTSSKQTNKNSQQYIVAKFSATKPLQHWYKGLWYQTS